jgi:hypothetical protein
MVWRSLRRRRRDRGSRSNEARASSRGGTAATQGSRHVTERARARSREACDQQRTARTRDPVHYILLIENIAAKTLPAGFILSFFFYF